MRNLRREKVGQRHTWGGRADIKLKLTPSPLGELDPGGSLWVDAIVDMPDKLKMYD